MTVFAQSAKSVNLNIALKDMSFVPFMSMTAREIEKIFFILIQNAIDAPPFYYAEDYHQQYLAKNPAGYCGLGGTGVGCPTKLAAI